MKAIQMQGVGGPEQLVLAEVPQPQPTAGEILVRIKAAGVNPVDTKLRSKGTYYPERLPAILGCDGAGEVAEIGPGVSRFQVGDAVYFCDGGIGGKAGNYAEYAVVHEDHAAAKPAGLDFADAGAAPLVLITAWEALHDRVGIQAGHTVLIHAGAGGVGHVAIQLARAADCRVITTVSDGEKEAFVKSLGADEVIRYREQDVVQRCLDLTAGAGVDVVFDTVGGAVFEQSFAALRPYGDIVTLLQPDGVNWKTARMKNLRSSMTLMLSPMYYDWAEARRHQAWILEQCATLCDGGKLRIEVAREFALTDAAEAHRLIEAGGFNGKLVLIP